MSLEFSRSNVECDYMTAVMYCLNCIIEQSRDVAIIDVSIYLYLWLQHTNVYLNQQPDTSFSRFLSMTSSIF